MKNVDLIILGGGFGTRLKSISKNIPKLLCEINKEPFLKYLLGKIELYNFDNVIISCGYLGGQVNHWIEENGYKEKIIIRQEKSPQGTGGAIRYSSLKNNNDKVVINGDTIFNIDFNQFYDTLSKTCDVGIGVKHVKKSKYKDSGFIKIDENMNVLSFNEKKDIHDNLEFVFINIGIYYFKHDVLAAFSKKTPLSLEYDVFPSLINNYSFKAFNYDDILIDYGTLKGYKDAQDYFSNHK